MTTLTQLTVQKIVRRLLQGEDYRTEIVALINAEFLEYVLDFFKRVVEAKMRNATITADWYRAEFLNPSLPSGEIDIHSGLNQKTIANMYNSARKEVVIQAAFEHYERLYETINELIEQGEGIDFSLTIKLNRVSVELSMNESLIVINTLAVKRAQLRGDVWSSAGKQVEKTLMRMLCKLYHVPDQNYNESGLSREQRELDFSLIDQHGRRYACEVKLMGKGNPESADATIARDTDVFIADKLSDLNKQQLTRRGIEWVELRSPNGYQKFQAVLSAWNIPHQPFSGSLDERLEEIFASFSTHRA